MANKLLISILFLMFISNINAQIKFSDLEHSFVKKSKNNKSGVISLYNGKKYTGTINYYDKTFNEKTFYKFKKGIITEYLMTRNDSIFYKATYKAGYMHIIEEPHWRDRVEQSSIAYLSDNKIDSIYWFLKGELLSKIYYTYPKPNIKTESFYHCLNQAPVLSYQCTHQYENEPTNYVSPVLYSYALNIKLIGKEITYNPNTGLKTHENVYKIIDGKSTKISSIDFNEKSNQIR